MMDIERLERGYVDELTCSIGSIAGAVGGIVSGVMGAGAATDAANAQKNAGQKAIDALSGANSTVQTGYQPYTAAGTDALSKLSGSVTGATPFTMSDFMSDPGYQFQLQQGQNAIQSSAAARGGVLGGGTLKALQQYTTGLASTTYGDAYSRYLQTAGQRYSQLSGIAGLGLNAQGGAAFSTLSTARGVADQETGIGNAEAAGIIGKQNAINGAIGAVTGAANQYSSSNRLSANPISLLGQVL